ncbi:MAG TPA: hypothetical protein VF590_14430 [Isosphaeraceae bacterium]
MAVSTERGLKVPPWRSVTAIALSRALAA